MLNTDWFTVYRDDTESRELLFYFEHEGTIITNPYISECGRFEVDPVKYYKLTHIEVSLMDSYNESHYDATYIE